ncbi:MAG: DNA-binding response regulator [Muribaculaceae bacterium]|nr:DNA-binding response regulator [Muribaculaceae bacterium]
MKLLIVDDNKAVRTALRLLLDKEFDEIVAVGDPQLIPALLQAGNVDVVLLDMNFDNTKLDCSDGFFWLSRIKGEMFSPAVVVVTAFGDVEIAVEAMKMGADDYVTKPWDNDVLIGKLKSAVAKNRLHQSDSLSIMKAKEIEKERKMMENMTLDEMKTYNIRQMLERCGGNISADAESLGINRQTLYNILRKSDSDKYAGRAKRGDEEV